MSRVVVTGAAGFIGGRLCHRLQSAGADVSGIDSLVTGDWARAPEAMERMTLDLRDPDVAGWHDLLRDADTVFHLAAAKYNSPGSTPEVVLETNVVATDRLIRGAAAAGVRRLVFTSSLYAYGSLGPDPMSEGDLPTPTTHYGVSKLAGEHLLRVAARDTTVEWAVARLFFVYGPGQYAGGGYKSVIVTNFERLLRGEPPVVNGDGRQRLDYVYLDDAVEALLALADTPSGTLVNVCSGHAPSVAELTETMLDVAGSPLRPVPGPADWTAGSVRVGDPGMARRLFGWQATTPLRAGLQLVWDSIASGAAA